MARLPQSLDITDGADRRRGGAMAITERPVRLRGDDAVFLG